MNREHLFKAKRVNWRELPKEKWWVEGLPGYDINGKITEFEFYKGFSDCENCDIDPNTLCEYTGLTDKNGRKIFEGDIVKYQFDNDDCPFPNKHTEKIIGKIFFSDFRASFSVTAGQNCSTSLNNDLFKYVQNGNRVEVIGNIFDNQELLGEDDF